MRETARLRYTVEKDLAVPMRDGVELATDVWRLDGSPAAPTVLVRTPYGKDLHPLHAQGTSPDLLTLLDAGYTLVLQDCRGTAGSGGTLTPMRDEPADGVDTLDWIVTQPWSNGRVAMCGASYVGFTQWASTSHPALRAIAPAMTAPDLYDVWYSRGVPAVHAIALWTTVMGLAGAARDLPMSDSAAPADIAALVERLSQITPRATGNPVAADPVLLRRLPWLTDWLAHPGHDDHWRGLAVAPSSVTTPTLQIAGWFDPFVDAAVTAFTEQRLTAGRLVIGPWDHTSATGAYPERVFGPAADAAAADLTGLHRRFFDHWLRDEPARDEPPVRIFVMGSDEWRDLEEWPPPGTREVAWYLSAGRLGTAEPRTDGSGEFRHNPADPVPSTGGRMLLPAAASGAGPADQRKVEARPDVLCFTSAVLDRPVEVIGWVTLVLHVSSSATDTDLTGKLVDVFPDGRALYLTDGILRARYRNSASRPEPLTPGQVYELRLDLSVTANVFQPGHRIRLEVAGSNFPRWDRHPHPAVSRVHYGPAHPSRLLLPSPPTIDNVV